MILGLSGSDFHDFSNTDEIIVNIINVNNNESSHVNNLSLPISSDCIIQGKNVMSLFIQVYTRKELTIKKEVSYLKSNFTNLRMEIIIVF